MSHAWVRHKKVQWAVVELDHASTGYDLVGGDMPIKRRNGGLSDAPMLVPDRGDSARTGLKDAWVVVCGRDDPLWVNGLPLAATGIHVLNDRDEVLLNDRTRLYFSTERLARAEPFVAGEVETICPRCKKPIETGTLAVPCPGCDVWYHEDEGRPCWTYAATCVLCSRSTDMSAGYTWTPLAL